MTYSKFSLKWVVYGIVDPRDHLIFYVGYTKCLTDRKMGHKPNQSCRSSIRIAELYEQNLKPSFIVLEECETEYQALRSEVFWVEMFRSRGTVLMNDPDWVNTESSPRSRNGDDPNWKPPMTQRRIEKKRETAASRGFPDRTGQSWSNEEDGRLLDLFRQGATVDELSDAFQRTTDGIAARLVRLGAAKKRSDALNQCRLVERTTEGATSSPTL